MKSSPILTVITVNYNNAIGLQATFDSILPQLTDEINYVVIDGGSSDCSPEIINGVASQLHYYCSEPDGGIYQGMNKGVSHANGQYVLFINSGDKLLPGILQKILPYLRANSADIVYGNLINAFPQKNRKRLITFPDRVSLNQLYFDYMPHPASFIRRQLLVDMPYNEQLRIIADWEFFVKAIMYKGVSTLHLPITISVFELGGISTIDVERKDAERQLVTESLFTPILREAAELTKMQSMECFPEIVELSHTRKLHRRIRPLLRLILNVDRFFHSKK